MFFRYHLARKLSHLTNPHVSPPLISLKVKAFVQQALYIEALQLYSNSPLTITKFTFPTLLKACASLPNLQYGKIIHSSIITMGLHSNNPYIATSLINMYVKCTSLSYARKVFDILPNREVLTQDVTIWNTMIDGYFKFGHIEEGLIQFGRMLSLAVKPDCYSLSILLGVCKGYKQGKKIHGYIVRNIFDIDTFLETALIDMYFGCTSCLDAWRVFRNQKEKNNIVPWNVVISGFCENGFFQNSLEVYSLAKTQGVKFMSTTFSSILSACYRGGNSFFGTQVHCDVTKIGFESDLYVCTSLVSMYGQCQILEDAMEVFNRALDKGIELWNSTISVNTINGYPNVALELFNKMKLTGLRPDSFTISNILSSVITTDTYDLGKLVHAEISKRPLQNNATVQSALLTMYSKCENSDYAMLIFKMMEDRDVIVWGAMISGYCQNKKFVESLKCYKDMLIEGVKPDSDIMASILIACARVEDVELGSGIHGLVTKTGLDNDIFVASSLIDMYSKSGFPESSRDVFFAMPDKNLVIWNSMISCYSRNGFPDYAIDLFSQIIQNGLYPDSVSFTSSLVAVSAIAALLKGKAMHGYLTRHKVPSDLWMENALIDMYMKCGCLKYASNVFDNMSQRNIVSWNSMIAGYGYDGDSLVAIRLFDEMRVFGVDPDDITFSSLLSSCNHSGSVEEGISVFKSMRDDYGIEPKMEHYANIVDLLGRGGRLDDAYNVIKNMNIEPDKSIWLCLLSASRIHNNMKFGEMAAKNLFQTSGRGSDYVQLSHLYGEAENWEMVANLRVTMKDKGLKKKPGCSWIEQRKGVKVFYPGDSSSPRTAEIYESLHYISENMQRKEDAENEQQTAN